MKALLECVPCIRSRVGSSRRDTVETQLDPHSAAKNRSNLELHSGSELSSKLGRFSKKKKDGGLITKEISSAKNTAEMQFEPGWYPSAQSCNHSPQSQITPEFDYIHHTMILCDLRTIRKNARRP